MASDGGKLCRCGCCGCLTVLVIILFAVSWSSLEYQEYGLDCNGIRNTVDPTPFGSGRYFLGFGHHFVVFPRTYQTVEYSNHPEAIAGPLQSRTKDGVEVVVMISFQYQIQQANLFQLYQAFGDPQEGDQDGYAKVFSYVARDILTDASTQYDAFSFFKNRTDIGDYMWRKLRKEFADNYFADVVFFQLKDVDLPDPFEAAIQSAEVARQSKQRAIENQKRELIDAQTHVIQGTTAAAIVIQEANAAANATITQNLYDVQAFNFTQQARLQAYESLQDSMDMNGSELIDYIKVSAADKNAAGAVISMGGKSFGGS